MVVRRGKLFSVGLESVDFDEGAERFGGTPVQLVEHERVAESAKVAVSRRHCASVFPCRSVVRQASPRLRWNRGVGDLAEPLSEFRGNQFNSPDHDAGNLGWN